MVTSLNLMMIPTLKRTIFKFAFWGKHVYTHILFLFLVGHAERKCLVFYKRYQAEQEQNHRYGDHLEDYQQGGEDGDWGERCRDYEVQIGRYKIDRGMLRKAQVMEKPKNLHDPWTWTKEWGRGGGCWREGGYGLESGKGEKLGQLNSIINTNT